MITQDTEATGQFCWVDLAATDAARAKAFYGQLFGWSSDERPSQGGNFTHLRLAGRDIGSLYQLNRAHLERGVPSHWTPYIQVANLDAAILRVLALGGEVAAWPFSVPNLARVALILDSVGGAVGPWEPTATDQGEEAND